MLLVLNPSEEAPRGAVEIDVTSRSETWSRGLSPFILPGGKTWTGDWAENVENLWQYSKVYQCHVDKDKNPNEEWFQWSKEGWANTRAMRYPMGKGAIPLYSYWDGKKYGYLEAKEKLYTKMYFRSVKNTLEFEKLKTLYKDCKDNNVDLVLRDFDAYNHVNSHFTFQQVMKHTKRKFGHGFVLAFMLAGILDEKGNLKETVTLF